MARYKLNALTTKGSCRTIIIPGEKELTDLPFIDSFTIGEDPISLYHKLELDFKIANCSNSNPFFISYKHNSQEKQCNVIFADAGGGSLKRIANDRQNKISLSNKVFQEFMFDKFLPLLKNEKFNDFLLKCDILNGKNREWLYYYRQGDTETAKQHIYEHSSYYSEFRKIVLAVELYCDPKFWTRTNLMVKSVSESETVSIKPKVHVKELTFFDDISE